MILVILESPYAGDRQRNLLYLRDAIRDSLKRGEAPYASHGLYTNALEDSVPEQRERGLAAGHAFREVVKKCVVYRDLGISSGMEDGMRRSRQLGQEIEYRTLDGWKP